MERPRSHIIEKKSKTFLEDFFADWVCNELHNDYALDFNIVITEDGITTEVNFFVQNKATDHIDISGNFVNLDKIEPRYLIYYSRFIQPVLIIRYDAQNNCAYWINAQKYVKNILDVEKPEWRKNKTSIRIKIPIPNQLTDINIIKNEIINSSNQNIGNSIKKFEVIKTMFYSELRLPSISDLIDIWRNKDRLSFSPNVMLPIIFAENTYGNIIRRQWGMWIQEDLLLNTLTFGLLNIFDLIDKCKQLEKKREFIENGMEYLILYNLLRLEVDYIVETTIEAYAEVLQNSEPETFYEIMDFIFKPIIGSIFHNFLKVCCETIEISCKKCSFPGKGNDYFNKFFPYELIKLSKHPDLILLSKENRCEIGIVNEGESCPLLNTHEDYKISDRNSFIEVLNFIKKAFLNIRDTIFRKGG